MLLDEEPFPAVDVSDYVLRMGPYAPGWFYAIQLDPSRDASRLKLGFSRNVPKRLKTYRTVYPDAKVIDCWVCSSIAVEKDVLSFMARSFGDWGRVGKTEIFEVFTAESWNINTFLDEVARALKGVETQEEEFVRKV